MDPHLIQLLFRWRILAKDGLGTGHRQLDNVLEDPFHRVDTGSAGTANGHGHQQDPNDEEDGAQKDGNDFNGNEEQVAEQENEQVHDASHKVRGLFAGCHLGKKVGW